MLSFNSRPLPVLWLIYLLAVFYRFSLNALKSNEKLYSGKGQDMIFGSQPIIGKEF